MSALRDKKRKHAVKVKKERDKQAVKSGTCIAGVPNARAIKFVCAKCQQRHSLFETALRLAATYSHRSSPDPAKIRFPLILRHLALETSPSAIFCADCLELNPLRPEDYHQEYAEDEHTQAALRELFGNYLY